MADRRSGLVTRIVGATVAVAVVAVVIAGLAALPLIRSAALAQTQATLGRLADLSAAALNRGDERGRVPHELEEALRSEQVQGYVVTSPDAQLPGIDRGQIAALLAGQSLSAVGESGGETLLVEGRPLAGGSAVVLLQPVAAAVVGVAGPALWRVVIALALGLLVAIPVGTFVARRMARPLRAARDAADSMAAGARDVRIEPKGPREIADIAVALNTLSAALAVSEGRQREFLMTVSHELRTPLTAIRGYGEALADGVIPPEDDAKTGATIATEAQRLDRLVVDLLDLARMGAVDFHVDPVEVDLQDVLREAGEVWASRCAREQVVLVEEAVADPVVLRTDPLRVRQIIDNLAENALRIVPAGARIVFRLAIDSPQPGWAVIEVRDSGPGIAPEDMPVAFSPGILHERYRGVRPVGTGLGLAIVQRLAQGLGGAASVSRAPEGGACFSVRLPMDSPNPRSRETGATLRP
jgi:two-component system sensor histidine kinase BaeS